MNIDNDRLRSLLTLLKEEGVLEFEHEDSDVKVRIVRGVAAHAHPAAVHVTATASAPQNSVAPAAAVDPDTVDVTSPFVGTFYRSPSPESPSFAEVGSSVRVGQTLCIVEAMKLMNEIESEVAGTIVEVLAQNGKAVEFGQKLFRIKKA